MNMLIIYFILLQVQVQRKVHNFCKKDMSSPRADPQSRFLQDDGGNGLGIPSSPRGNARERPSSRQHDPRILQRRLGETSGTRETQTTGGGGYASPAETYDDDFEANISMPPSDESQLFNVISPPSPYSPPADGRSYSPSYEQPPRRRRRLSSSGSSIAPLSQPEQGSGGEIYHSTSTATSSGLETPDTTWDSMVFPPARPPRPHAPLPPLVNLVSPQSPAARAAKRPSSGGGSSGGGGSSLGSAAGTSWRRTPIETPSSDEDENEVSHSMVFIWDLNDYYDYNNYYYKRCRIKHLSFFGYLFDKLAAPLTNLYYRTRIRQMITRKKKTITTSQYWPPQPKPQPPKPAQRPYAARRMEYHQPSHHHQVRHR